MSKQQSMLFLVRTAPYASNLASAGLDLLLTAAAFDQDVTLVFSDDAVYQLIKEQNSENIGLKNTSKVLPALELYDVNKIMVEQSSMESRELKQTDFIIPVNLLPTAELAELLESVDQVFTF